MMGNFDRELDQFRTQLVGTIQEFDADQADKDELVELVKKYGEYCALVAQNKFYQDAFAVVESHRPKYPYW